MRQFGFETDIERRMPTTGKVFMIDRMTSDWAERHPLNVDQFIEDVYQEFAGTEFEEQRELLHKVWTATLSMPIQGDKTIYPNNGGAHRPAAMKVWMMAGDYWRRGLRPGDTLPERCPSTKITRLPDGGWIALFPKDVCLLEGSISLKIDVFDKINVVGQSDTMDSSLPVTGREERAEDRTAVHSDKTQAILSPYVPKPEAKRKSKLEINAERRQRRLQREAQRMAYEEQMEREVRESEEAAREQELRKIFAAVGAAAVTLVMIYFFGLLGPAAFGLLAGGLLKG